LKYIVFYFRKSKAVFKISTIFEKIEYLDFLTPSKPFLFKQVFIAIPHILQGFI